MPGTPKPKVYAWTPGPRWCQQVRVGRCSIRHALRYMVHIILRRGSIVIIIKTTLLLARGWVGPYLEDWGRRGKVSARCGFDPLTSSRFGDLAVFGNWVTTYSYCRNVLMFVLVDNIYRALIKYLPNKASYILTREPSLNKFMVWKIPAWQSFSDRFADF